MKKRFWIGCAALLVAGSLAIANVVVMDADDNAYLAKRYKWAGEEITVTILLTNSISVGYVKIGDLPEGHIVIHGAMAKDVYFSPGTKTLGLTNDSSGDFAIGTVAATGGTNSGTEVNIIPNTALAGMTNRTDAVLADDAMIDGSDTACDIVINLLIDGDVATAIQTNTVSTYGELTIFYSILGDD